VLNGGEEMTSNHWPNN